MKREFWQARWDTRQIGFHEGRPNELLVAYADRFAPKSRILVPLAGRAADLGWLADRGHEVVGVEFVRRAIDELFEGVDVRAHRLGPHKAFSARGITMVLGDMFAMKPADLGTFDAIYDRAALIALEPSTRAGYVEVCAALNPRGPTLLIAFAYDQSKTPGPPFSIDGKTVRDLFAGRSVEHLETRPASVSPRMRESGVDSIDETIYRIGYRIG
jgi:thiopurine S-methyltransferase